MECPKIAHSERHKRDHTNIHPTRNHPTERRIKGLTTIYLFLEGYKLKTGSMTLNKLASLEYLHGKLVRKEKV